MNVIYTRKTKIIILILLLLSLFSISLLFMGFSIYSKVYSVCQKAQNDFGKNCQESLIMTLSSTSRSFREKNEAIWALGQLANKSSLPILRKHYTGKIPNKEPYDKNISQYELKKAINWCEKGNLTSWMYYFIR